MNDINPSVDNIAYLLKYDSTYGVLDVDVNNSIVGKALSRQSIEVTERNQPSGSFTIQFDPTNLEVEEGTLWDEFEFFFGEEKHQDQQFHILLADNGQKTEVVVTDEKGMPQTKGPGLGVLVVLFESIKEDLVGSQ